MYPVDDTFTDHTRSFRLRRSDTSDKSGAAGTVDRTSRYRMLAVTVTNRPSGAFGRRGLAPALAKARVAQVIAGSSVDAGRINQTRPSARRTGIHCPNGIRKACAAPAVARSCAAPAGHHALMSTYAATTDPTTAPP